MVILSVVFLLLLLVGAFLAYRLGRADRGDVLEELRQALLRQESYSAGVDLRLERRSAEIAILEQGLAQIKQNLVATIVEREHLEKEVKRLTKQKKSSEVRTGLIAEQMAPFLTGFPYDPKEAKFLGKPIDFIVFGEGGIHFIEVKSGKAQLTTAQRRIRDQIESGAVSFEIYRVEGG
jgi:predicted Holliday junction resolvase-like endonuclease